MSSQNISTLYKLIILYMIEVTKSPLSNSDISDYILDKGYTDSIKLQIAINELIDEGLITPNTMHNRTYLSLTDDGTSTIESLESRISPTVRSKIYEYLIAKKSELNEKHSILTSHHKSDSGYTANFIAKDKDGELMNLSLSFPTEALAISACENFNKNSSDIYSFIIGKLMQ